MAPIDFHMSWPNGNDPYYRYNMGENNARRSFYTFNTIPTLRYEGKELGDPSDFPNLNQYYSWLRTTLDSLYRVPAKIEFDVVDQTIVSDSVFVTFDVIVRDVVNGTFNLYMAAVEESSNIGYFKYRHIFRDMIPAASGEAITLNTGDSLRFDWSWGLVPDGAGFIEDMSTNIWLQKPINKKVLQTIRVPIPDITTDMPEGAAPMRIVLGKNVPNPFNPTTTIDFHLDREREVRLVIFDQAGRVVNELVSGAVRSGPHTVTWDGRDGSGREVGSGVYFYRLDAGETALTDKMVLIR